MRKSIAILVVLLVAAAAVFIFFHAPAPMAQQSMSAPSVPVPPTALRVPPPGYKEYRNTRYGFSLLYPQDFAVTAQDSGGGASTITFQNTATVQGFQIFIVPYAQPQVSEAQFNKDEPSGVRDNLKTVTIDGSTGASFNGEDTRLGATSEVWVVHGGYLFEATTIEPLQNLLDQVMQSWQFI